MKTDDTKNKLDAVSPRALRILWVAKTNNFQEKMIYEVIVWHGRLLTDELNQTDDCGRKLSPEPPYMTHDNAGCNNNSPVQ